MVESRETQNGRKEEREEKNNGKEREKVENVVTLIISRIVSMVCFSLLKH